jgi:hypothetical protein
MSVISRFKQIRECDEVELWLVLLVLFVLVTEPFRYLSVHSVLVGVSPDFGAYYFAAERFLEGANIYANELTTSTNGHIIHHGRNNPYPFIYVPISVLIWIPFTFFPPIVALTLWEMFMVLIVIVSMILLIYSLGVELSIGEIFIVGFSILGFMPVLWGIVGGNVEVLLAAISGSIVASVIYFDKNYVAVVLTSIVVVLKPYYAPIGLFAFKRDDRRDIKILMLTILGIFVLSIVLFGIDTHIDWIGKVAAESKVSGHISTQSFPGSLFIGIGTFGKFKWLASASIVATFLYFTWKYREEHDLGDEIVSSLGLVGIILIYPRSYIVTQIVVLYIVVVMLYIESERISGTLHFPMLVLLLVHIQVPMVRYLSAINLFPELLTPFVKNNVKYLQPALYGIFGMAGRLLYNLSNPEHFEHIC